MRVNCVTIGVAALLLLAGCGKSTNTANQPSTDTTAQSQSAAGQNAAPANTTNPATAPAPTPAPPPPPKPFELAEGTSIPVILSSQIDSRVNKGGEDFQASVAAPILVDGEEAIPKGAAVSGTIVAAKKQGSVKGEASLSLRITTITVRGKDYAISSSTYAATEKGKGKRSAVLTGGGAAVGALIGGLAGGGKGAAIGAGVGGGGGLAASAGTGGQNVVLPAESRITFKLTKAITVDR